jgi:hypothetical protein
MSHFTARLILTFFIPWFEFTYIATVYRMLFIFYGEYSQFWKLKHRHLVWRNVWFITFRLENGKRFPVEASVISIIHFSLFLSDFTGLQYWTKRTARFLTRHLSDLWSTFSNSCKQILPLIPIRISFTAQFCQLSKKTKGKNVCCFILITRWRLLRTYDDHELRRTREEHVYAEVSSNY